MAEETKQEEIQYIEYTRQNAFVNIGDRVERVRTEAGKVTDEEIVYIRVVGRSVFVHPEIKESFEAEYAGLLKAHKLKEVKADKPAASAGRSTAGADAAALRGGTGGGADLAGGGSAPASGASGGGAGGTAAGGSPAGGGGTGGRG
jgi:hypothetical protein